MEAIQFDLDRFRFKGALSIPEEGTGAKTGVRTKCRGPRGGMEAIQYDLDRFRLLNNLGIVGEMLNFRLFQTGMA